MSPGSTLFVYVDVLETLMWKYLVCFFRKYFLIYVVVPISTLLKLMSSVGNTKRRRVPVFKSCSHSTGRDNKEERR